MAMLNIIPFQNQFTQQVFDLILPIQQIEFKVPITIQDQPDLLTIDSFYQKDKGQFWVALIDEKVVGTIALIDCGEGIGCIRKMFVMAQYRGKEMGIAQQLFDTLLVHAKQKGFKALYLGTIERLKAAIGFYERNGFQLIEKNNLPISFPIMAVDTHFFELKI